MPDYHYAFIFFDALIGCVWLALYLSKKSVRKEMLHVSLWTAPLGPLSELFYIHDYWRPEYLGGLSFGIEDLLFAFFIGGIGAVICEALMGPRWRVGHTRRRRNTLVPLVLVGIAWMYAGVFWLGLNSIYVSSLGLLAVGTVLIHRCKSYLRDAVMSGVLTALIMFAAYQILFLVYPNIIARWWFLDSISGMLVIGVPIEELLWAFSWGFFVNPLYEFIVRKRPYCP